MKKKLLLLWVLGVWFCACQITKTSSLNQKVIQQEIDLSLSNGDTMKLTNPLLLYKIARKDSMLFYIKND